MGAAAVQGDGQVQGIFGPQAKGWIVQQLGSLSETAAVEATQFQAALQQAL